MADDLLIGMAGAGGDGVVSAGESLITAAALEGYHAILTKSFGPQIRGGESSFRCGSRQRRVLQRRRHLDVAVALNWDDFLRFGAELPVGGRHDRDLRRGSTRRRAGQAAARGRRCRPR